MTRYFWTSNASLPVPSPDGPLPFTLARTVGGAQNGFLITKTPEEESALLRWCATRRSCQEISEEEFQKRTGLKPLEPTLERPVVHTEIDRKPRQTLLNPDNRKAPTQTFYHSGDLGDIVYSLEVIRRMGGGKLSLGSEMGLKFPSRCRETMTPYRVALIEALLRNQSYIDDVAYCEELPNPDWINLNRFREIFRGSNKPSCTSLQRAMVRRFGFNAQDETRPWLTVASASSRARGKIAVARSARYHNPAFPWKRLVERYGNRMVFVGLVGEHTEFCREFGEIEQAPTENMLAAAHVIKGSAVFMGNQSCPYAIAEGFKHPAVQETWVQEPNCLFQRPNVLHLTADFDQISQFIERYI